LLDHGGIQEAVSVQVANLLPFLVLKAFAIDERDKMKDSYDVVWTLSPPLQKFANVFWGSGGYRV